jgi:ribA/ribD-fused uncharacterized protein
MIDEFRGENRYLSNFHILEKPIKTGILTFKTNEHFYQAHKTLDLNDRIWIADQPTPGLAKKAGSIEGLNDRKIQLRNDWREVQCPVMYMGLVLKFMNNYPLAAHLLSTGDELLIEGNWWHDNFWGDCKCPKCAHIKGKNNLGLLLMQLRKTLKIIGV